MINFNEETYLRIGKGAMKLKSRIDEITAAVTQKGYKNLFLIGSGGSAAMFMPFEHFLKTKSTIPAYLEIAAELVVSGHNQLGKESVCIFTSSSGTTSEPRGPATVSLSPGFACIAQPLATPPS